MSASTEAGERRRSRGRLVRFAAVLAALNLLLAAGAVAVRLHQDHRPDFVVTGNRIVDRLGHTVAVHGVDRPSLEFSCAGEPVGVTGTGIPASDFTTMARDGANTVRLALNEDSWLSATEHLPVATPCPHYPQTVAAVVAEARAAGLVVILDLHWSDAGQPGRAASQHCAADPDSATFWSQVARQFAGDQHVWFELYNEPHSTSWAVWRDGGQIDCDGISYPAVGQQALLEDVRAAGAHNLVLVDGLDYGYDLSGVAAYPLHGSGVVYATHPYASKGPPSDWPRAFGDIAASVPVVATEFGRTDCAASSPYDQEILTYLASHGVGYTAWAWWSGGCAFPSLLTGTHLNAVGARIMASERAIGNDAHGFVVQRYQPLP